MTDALLTLSDAMLAHCRKDPIAPHYTEYGFEQKMDLARRREPRTPFPRRKSAFDYLMQREWLGLLRAARLTLRQFQVFLLRARGCTFEEIGRCYGHSKQAAQSIFRLAIKKIRRVSSVYPLKGLCEVYRLEVRRGTGRRRR